MQYEIVQSETKTIETIDDSGVSKNVLFLAANLYEAEAQTEMTSGLFERFKIQRMMSSPDTSMLVITVIGPCDADSFVTSWRELVFADPIATFFMSQMEKADFAMALTQKADAPQFRSLLETGSS